MPHFPREFSLLPLVWAPPVRGALSVCSSAGMPAPCRFLPCFSPAPQLQPLTAGNGSGGGLQEAVWGWRHPQPRRTIRRCSEHGAWYRRTAASTLCERLCLLILLSEPLLQRPSFLGVGIIFLRSLLSLKHWALCGAVLCEMMEKACTY